MQSTDDGTCDFRACNRKVHAQRLCNSHYAQLRSGQALKPLRRIVRGTLAERAAAYTDRSSDCWLWTGGVNAEGYGRIRADGQMRLAHRVIYELVFGAVPDGMEIDHKCHVRLCVRPEHLHVVTPTENQENRSGATRTSRSGIRGVYWNKANDRWVVKVGHRRKLYHGGSYDVLQDAANAAAALRMKLHTNNLADQATASTLSSVTT